MVWVFVLLLIPFGYVARWVDLLAHEAAHAIVARLFGHAVFQVRMGTGRPAKVIRFGLLSIHLSAWPTSGCVTYASRARRVPRTHDILISAAGPFASVSLVVLGCLGLNTAIEIPGSIGGCARLFFFMLTCSSVFSATVSLLPLVYDEGGERRESDGLRILGAFSRAGHDVIPALVHAEFKRGVQLFSSGETRRGARLIARALRDESLRQDADSKVGIASCLASAGCVETARSICREILSDPAQVRGSAARQNAADVLACLPIYWDRRDLLEEGLAVITSAIEEFPDAITLRGTLGGILYELGEPERAEPILTEVADCSENDLDRAITSVYLAAIHAARGEVEEADGYLETARFKGRTHPQVGRILERLLPSIPNYEPPAFVSYAFSRAPHATMFE